MLLFLISLQYFYYIRNKNLIHAILRLLQYTILLPPVLSHLYNISMHVEFIKQINSHKIK